MKSSFKQHRLGAVIVKGKRILSTGFNKYGYNSHNKTPTMHAEASAVLKLLKQRRLADLVGADIYVFRYTNAGNIGLARPCSNCWSLLRAVGISHVYYTCDNGEVNCESIN